jgi:hypothetical protein
MILVIEHRSGINQMERQIGKDGWLSNFFRASDRIYRKDRELKKSKNKSFKDVSYLAKIIQYDKANKKLVTGGVEESIEEHVKYCI